MADNGEDRRKGICGWIDSHRFSLVASVLWLLAFTVALYGLMVTAHTDTIVQNTNSFLWLPYRCRADEVEELELSSLEASSLERGDDEGTFALFALDISASPNMHQLSSDQKLAFQDGLMEVRDELVVTHTRWDHLEENYINLAKVRLCQLLIDLRELSAEEKGPYSFAIWTVGDSAVDFLGHRPDVSEKAVREAICKLLDDPTQLDGNTNLAQVFHRLLIYLDQFCGSQAGQQGPPRLILTVLSDMEHDTRQLETEQAWREMDETIPELCSAPIMVNLIILSTSRQPGFDVHDTIVAVFDRNIDPHRLNKTFIGEGKLQDFLHQVVQVRDQVAFYYTNPNDIDGASVYIKADKRGRLLVDMPLEIGQEPPSRIGIYCEPMTSEGYELEDGSQSRRLLSGRNSLDVKLEKGQKLKLTYSGTLPVGSPPPVLRLSLADSYMTLLVPIRFIKRLPDWAVSFLIGLHAFFVGVCVALTVLLRICRMRTAQEEPKAEVAGEPAPGGGGSVDGGAGQAPKPAPSAR